MVSMLRSTKIKKRRDKGAAAVEFAYALFFLVGLVMVCFQIFAIFGVKQRVNYASYMGERSSIVGGNPVATANQLNNGGQVTAGSSGVTVRKILNLPVNLRQPWGGGVMPFEVSTEVNMPNEPVNRGDNF